MKTVREQHNGKYTSILTTNDNYRNTRAYISEIGGFERFNIPDEVPEVREEPVLDQAADGSFTLDNGGSDHSGVARKQLTTPNDGHEQPKRQTCKWNT